MLRTVVRTFWNLFEFYFVWFNNVKLLIAKVYRLATSNIHFAAFALLHLAAAPLAVTLLPPAAPLIIVTVIV